MKALFFRIISLLLGRNLKSTPTLVISKQLLEPRPLPVGRKEFEEWADRIIAGTMLQADVQSQKFTLANLIMHLGPTESHKPDAFFIHSLRKFASNQVADVIRCEIRDEAKARLAAQEALKPQAPEDKNEVLADEGIQVSSK